jgi:Prophage tail fibre N-terminal
MEHSINRARLVTGGRRVLPFIGLLAVALTMASAAKANARFVYETCDPAIPGGNPPTYSFHEPNAEGGNYQLFQSCATPGGSIGEVQSPKQVLPGATAELKLFIPPTPGGWIESLTLTANAGEYHGNAGFVYEPHWPVAGTGDNPRYFFLRSQPVVEPVTTPWTNGATFEVRLECGGAECPPGGAYEDAHFISALEVDPTAPTITSVEGPLVGGGALRGHQSIKAQASDVGGGVRSLELKVNGISMAGTALGACSIAYVENLSYKGIAAFSPTPCPPTLSDAWDVDTSAPPFQNGPNSIQVCASDFATKELPNTGCSAPRTIEVDNTCPESPVAGGADLDASFDRSGSEDLTVKFGSETKISGELTNGTGAGVPGATICLQVQPAETATAAQTVGTVTTDSEGKFTMEVRPGADRHLLIGYRHDSFQLSKTLSLGTRARPTLELSRRKIRGGEKVKITGKLPKPRPGGRVLVLQGSSAKGAAWLTFKKVTTGSRGRFKTRYRFTRPRRRTTFRIRAVSPAQAGYEYQPGASKVSRITVRP